MTDNHRSQPEIQGTKQSKRRRTLAKGIAIGAMVLLGLSLAACSSSSPSSSVASLGEHSSSSASTGTSSQAQDDRAEINFARCLRAHGINEPDPKAVPGHAGLFVQVPATSPATSAGLAACNHFLADLHSPQQEQLQQKRAAQLPALTRYAECMRAHDIAMLDPDPQTGSVDLGPVAGITDDFGRYSPQFRAADTACRQWLPAGVHDDGTGP